MSPITSSQKNRRERIAEAMRIEWNGLVDQYSVEHWLHTSKAIENAQEAGVFTDLPIWFAGKCHRVTLTAAQDLDGFNHESFARQQEAKAVR